jgi:hypothetical protein
LLVASSEEVPDEATAFHKNTSSKVVREVRKFMGMTMEEYSHVASSVFEK